MENHLNSDHHPREKVKSYEVNTVSLIDLLKMYDAPRFVEYLSIDTEGSEYDILSAFDWESYRFGLISVEHNFTNNRERIERLLTANGYRRILTDLSKFDDWYVAEGLFF